MTTTANQPKELWEAVLGDLQMHVTRPNFETWLKNTVGIAFRDGEFVVGAPNAFVAEMLEQRMYSLISLTAERVVKGPVEVRFQVLLSEEVDAA
ncbi:MAG TPA: chromosomal replication initiator protein DnaA, partial [Dehalococcoidia bacterium]|nr:chromosomal replication initiator protein DnaA [Dehalococcoidia bacterium]